MQFSAFFDKMRFDTWTTGTTKNRVSAPIAIGESVKHKFRSNRVNISMRDVHPVFFFALTLALTLSRCLGYCY